MDLGVYTSSLAISEETEKIIDSLNGGIDDGTLNSASMFVDAVGFNPLKLKCGCFDSSDLWNFSGTLVATTVPGLSRALGVVNGMSIVYYYGWGESPTVLGLIAVTSTNRVKVISKDEESDKEFFRLTGKKTNGIVNNFNIRELKEVISNE
jgi:hypothetical protein